MLHFGNIILVYMFVLWMHKILIFIKVLGSQNPMFQPYDPTLQNLHNSYFLVGSRSLQHV